MNASSFSLRSKPPTTTTFRPPKHPLLEPFKDRLIRYLDLGHVDHAFNLFDEMSHRGVPPDLVTYSVLLKSCIRRRDLSRGRLIHRRLLDSGIQPDSIMGNSLISLYSKCGELKSALEVFDEMGSTRNLVSWSAMISGHASNGMEGTAVRLFGEMMQLGLQPNEFCFAGLIKEFRSTEHVQIGLMLFGLAMKTGYFGTGVFVGCALIDMFLKTGDLDSARKVFDEMPVKNVVPWTQMITRYAQHGFPQDSMDLFLDMMLRGFEPDNFTISSVLTACIELGWYEVGRQLHSLAVRLGSNIDACVGCSLVDLYAKLGGSMRESRNVFDQMREHNVMSWTALITGYAQSGGRDREAIGLFCRMVEGSSIRPNHFTFSSVLKACANLADADMGLQVYAHVVKSGLSAVNFVGNSLVSMFSKSGRMEEARKAFDILFDKSLVSYNAMVDGYVENSNGEGALELLQEVETLDLGMDVFTYASLLSAAAGIGSIRRGQQLHGRVIKAMLRSDQGVGNALLSMYSRCGSIDDAWLAFIEMDRKNVISWTSMIAGFAKHGDAERALCLFDRMIESGVKPNDITYVAILSACSHAGLVTQGWEHFYSMNRDHGLVPKVDHYACMVDLLGRSGNLEEAVDFISSMPFAANVLVWRTLLGACRVHSNMEIGELAAQKILEMEPQDPAVHVLLSNLHASRGEWDAVAAIRSSMKQRSMTKEAGLSWMEVGNAIHKFHVGDTRHPLAEEIYAKLGEMASEIRRMGYLPDLNYVMHEVEEEKKEHYLFQHSEKIAVAFGLISTSAPRPIRIFKNLRVCGDCHNAINLISKRYGRVIILRDSKRFHTFRDGVCSCGDYW